MAESCDICRFWASLQSGAVSGECRFNAPFPLVDKTLSAVRSAWPVTASGNWCGEYLNLREHPRQV